MALKAISIALMAAIMTPRVSGHGWVTSPVSRNQVAFKTKEACRGCGSFKYEPQSSAVGNGFGQQPSTSKGAACGASESIYGDGPSVWQSKYDASKGAGMDTITPGSDIEVTAKLTADHGGQAWMMVACGDKIDETLNWRFMERAQSDRQTHFMANNPKIFAWNVGTLKATGARTLWTVPADFSCPNGLAVGRWLWKTANSCTDTNNVGRNTETFALADYSAVVGRAPPTCSSPPETFISCFDFKVSGPAGPAPSPTPSPPGATPAPTSGVETKKDCTECKASCQSVCNRDTGGVRLNQCWGSPSKYIECKCNDGSSRSFPGCPCEHSSCTQTGGNPVTQPTAPPTRQPVTPTTQPTRAPDTGGNAGGNAGSGNCVHNKDCATSAWCAVTSLESYCVTNGAMGYCPSPHCTSNAGALLQVEIAETDVEIALAAARKQCQELEEKGMSMSACGAVQ